MAQNKNLVLTPEENIVRILTGKKVLFLEDDESELPDEANEFCNILKRAKIEHTILLNVGSLPLETITSAINSHDAIVFQTTWTYEISKMLYEYIVSLPDLKIVVECYIAEPTWYYASQHGSKHDVYIYTCYVEFSEVDKDYEEFYKLTDKPYWDYENKFDN